MLWNWLVLMVAEPWDMLKKNKKQLYTFKGVTFVTVNSILRETARCPDKHGLVCEQDKGKGSQCLTSGT